MSGTEIIDLFATKGPEYLLAIGFLVALVLFWRWLNSSPRPAAAGARSDAGGRWFSLDRGSFYHQGHAWARPGPARRVKVGLDDFAQKLLGRPDRIEMPEVGANLTQGGPGWTLHVGSREIPMLCPVEGTVVARNETLEDAPQTVNSDPYGSGWLLEIETPRLDANLSNLLRGALARHWAAADERSLRKRMAGDLGTVLQDGGVPVSGIAMAIDEEQWDRIAREYLLTTDETA
jgi:glycine cleavage system H lipoate-binding protein